MSNELTPLTASWKGRVPTTNTQNFRQAAGGPCFRFVKAWGF